ncbi:hypothetical protein SADUNF_Sadunf01G0176200 [Salix dunnii]|uniref:TF-B3 domain-containing protein n=1 Tax=Salix dunnii TaxID=1413687 RepID=A0A835NC37_9ROSI|nr:hypothetical protein SADUNF_Sadunf01G0176200 [Salix dunnii]
MILSWIKWTPEIVDDLGPDEAVEDKEVNKQKLRKRIDQFKIELKNPCRPGKKLLVLDIDYTLFDHRSTAENPLELMRPSEYDIMTWSATRGKGGLPASLATTQLSIDLRLLLESPPPAINMTRRLFEKTLSKTDVEYRLAIPMDSLSAFQAFQIPEGEYSKKVDFFDNNGCRWSFRYSTRKNDPHPKPVLSSGWIKFVKEKGLKEGDQVIFSVSDRDGAEGLQFGIEARKRVQLSGQVLWSDLATTQLSIDLRSLLESPPPAINMTRRLFEKTLSKTDVEYRLAIPMDSLSAFQAFQIPEGEYSKKVDFFDNNGCRWSFRYSTRKNDPHPKPVLSSGWIKFVKEKGLKEGDQVIFSVSDRDGAEGLQFGIEARKRIQLSGQVLWSDPL